MKIISCKTVSTSLRPFNKKIPGSASVGVLYHTGSKNVIHYTGVLNRDSLYRNFTLFDSFIGMCYKGKSEPAYDLATGTITTINQIDIFTKPVYFWVKSNNPRQNSWNTWSFSPHSPFTKLKIAQAFPNCPF